MSRVYFITGASSGFGAELARVALKRGDRVVLTARRVDMLNAIAADYPDSALPLAFDIMDASARANAVRDALARFGRIDVLANIAGRGSVGAAEEFTPVQLREQMELNFFAGAELTRAVLPVFRQQGSGHVLQLTSIGGQVAIGGFAPYCASKFALEGWSEALRDEVAPFGIKVTIVEPGAFRTEFAGGTVMQAEERIEAYRPLTAPLDSYLMDSDGKQLGDPVKAAKAMIAVVESDTPPLRLILGQDAYNIWDSKREAMAADVQSWREVGIDTALEGAELTPIGGR
jgi:NAD(P)-dependent dehydrogenase (short-subunit alcohol dehydrogenase family)